MSAAPAYANDATPSAPGLVFEGGWVSEYEGNGTVWLDLVNTSDETATSGVVTISLSHEVSNVRSTNANAECQVASDDDTTMECSLNTPIEGHEVTEEYLQVEYTYPDDGDDWTDSTLTAQVGDGMLPGTTLSEDFVDNGDSVFF